MKLSKREKAWEDRKKSSDDFIIKEKYKFIYSILSLENSNLGLSHYFGLEISI